MNGNQVFDAALALAKADVIVAAAPALATFFANLSKQPPSGIVLVTQADLLRSSLTASLPQLGQTELTQIDNSFIGLIEAQLAAANAVITAANAAKPAAAKS